MYKLISLDSHLHVVLSYKSWLYDWYHALYNQYQILTVPENMRTVLHITCPFYVGILETCRMELCHAGDSGMESPSQPDLLGVSLTVQRRKRTLMFTTSSWWNSTIWYSQFLLSRILLYFVCATANGHGFIRIVQEWQKSWWKSPAGGLM